MSKRTKLILYSSPLLLYVVFVIGYTVTTPFKHHMYRSFTIGKTDDCELGNFFINTHLSDLSYIYLLTQSEKLKQLQNKKSIIHVALQGAQGCQTGEGYKNEASRLIRGIKLGVEYGEDINIINGMGMTPLHMAVFLNQREVAKFLVENGANLGGEYTPLQLAESLESEHEIDMSEIKEIVKNEKI